MGTELSNTNYFLQFYRDFVSYFQENEKTINTIGKNIKNLNVFLKEAYNQGLSDNRIFEEETEQIYLNAEEIQKIFEIDFQDKPKLDRVRDLFIVGCYTGLRYADLGQLNVDMISPKGELLKIETKKLARL